MATATQIISQPLEGFGGHTGVGNFKAPPRVKYSNNEVDHALSAWKYLCHPRLQQVQEEVEEYFLKNWRFSNAKAIQVFLNAKFSEVTCFYFPSALDDRIHFACRLLTVLFLIDGKSRALDVSSCINKIVDQLEDMSFADGEAYNANLIPISRGEVLPDRRQYLLSDRKDTAKAIILGSKPEEFILYDLWESMRAHDRELADAVLRPTFIFMRSQTDSARLTIKELGNYLVYRERDVGKAYVPRPLLVIALLISTDFSPH